MASLLDRVPALSAILGARGAAVGAASVAAGGAERGAPRVDPATVATIFDRAAPISAGDLTGWWRGEGIPTGHPLDGVLEAAGWWGKAFLGEDEVHPLVFRRASSAAAPAAAPADGAPREDAHRGLIFLDPGRLPLAALLKVAGSRPDRVARLRPVALRLAWLVATGQPTARVRSVAHRGIVSAAMVYDRLPIIDHFRAVDRQTLIAVMDWRGAAPYWFVLVREDAL